MEELFSDMPNIDFSMYKIYGQMYLESGDKAINTIIITAMIITGFIMLIIGIFIGQNIVLHMNKAKFEALEKDNEKMHYEIAEYKAKEAYEQKQIELNRQDACRPQGGEVLK